MLIPRAFAGSGRPNPGPLGNNALLHPRGCLCIFTAGQQRDCSWPISSCAPLSFTPHLPVAPPASFPLLPISTSGVVRPCCERVWSALLRLCSPSAIAARTTRAMRSLSRALLHSGFPPTFRLAAAGPLRRHVSVHDHASGWIEPSLLF